MQGYQVTSTSTASFFFCFFNPHSCHCSSAFPGVDCLPPHERRGWKKKSCSHVRPKFCNGEKCLARRGERISIGRLQCLLPSVSLCPFLVPSPSAFVSPWLVGVISAAIVKAERARGGGRLMRPPDNGHMPTPPLPLSVGFLCLGCG